MPRLFFVFWFLFSSLGVTEPPYPVTADDNIAWNFPMPSRVIAVGDIHADPQALLSVLFARKVIDAYGNWIAKDAHLVLDGDLCDRGPNSRAIFDIAIELAKEAEKHGGKVHAINGNHDLQIQTGDLRDVSGFDFLTFLDFSKKKKIMERAEEAAPLETKREKLAYLGGIRYDPRYSEFFRNRNSIVKIGDNIFVHAGLEDWAYQVTPGEINSTVRAWVKYYQGRAPMPPAETEWVLDNDGPLWTRKASEGRLNNSTLAKALRYLEASRVIVGHSPTESDEIEEKYAGKLIRIDTSMTVAYGGKLSAYEISRNGKTKHVNDIPRLPPEHPLLTQCGIALKYVGN